MVKFTESRKSFTHFLTQLCAILGGVITVSGLVDRIGQTIGHVTARTVLCSRFCHAYLTLATYDRFVA